MTQLMLPKTDGLRTGKRLRVGLLDDNLPNSLRLFDPLLQVSVVSVTDRAYKNPTVGFLDPVGGR
jgi:hypothetical protein